MYRVSRDVKIDSNECNFVELKKASQRRTRDEEIKIVFK